MIRFATGVVLGAILLLFCCFELGLCPFTKEYEPKFLACGIVASIFAAVSYVLEWEKQHLPARNLLGNAIQLMIGVLLPFALRSHVAAML